MNELFDCPYIYICRCCVVAKLCLTLCDPMDCSLPDSSVQEINPDTYGYLSLTKEAKIYKEEKIMSLTSGAGQSL